VEYDVDVHKELIYDDDLFTEQEEYNHLEETYKELQERFNTISTETDAKIKELTDKVAELNKKINTRSVWYKPWG
jgi:small-conductance mechanosensitive channel